jgi:predicted naringenin-chalcone synthase
LAGGGFLTYAWHAFPQPSVYLDNSAIDLIGNAVFAIGAVVLIAVAARRRREDKALAAKA